jgi:hypothetical protein
MPSAAPILLAWLGASMLVSPFIGTLLATGRRGAVVVAAERRRRI